MVHKYLIITPKKPGVIELTVGPSSMLINCPVLNHRLTSEQKFAIQNAMMQECYFDTNSTDGTCTVQIDDNIAKVNKKELYETTFSLEVRNSNTMPSPTILKWEPPAKSENVKALESFGDLAREVHEYEY